LTNAACHVLSPGEGSRLTFKESSAGFDEAAKPKPYCTESPRLFQVFSFFDLKKGKPMASASKSGMADA
jgi:hypothetical protein